MILTTWMQIFILSHILEREVIEELRRREMIPKYIALISSFHSYEFVMTDVLTDQVHIALPLNNSL